MAIFQRGPYNGEVKSRWSWQKLRFSANISGSMIAVWTTATVDHAVYSTDLHASVILLITTSMDDHNEEQRTEQSLIVRSDKFEAEVSNNSRLRSTFCTIEPNYWQTRSIAWRLCDSTATYCCYHCMIEGYRSLQLWSWFHAVMWMRRIDSRLRAGSMTWRKLSSPLMSRLDSTTCLLSSVMLMMKTSQPPDRHVKDLTSLHLQYVDINLSLAHVDAYPSHHVTVGHYQTLVS